MMNKKHKTRKTLAVFGATLSLFLAQTTYSQVGDATGGGGNTVTTNSNVQKLADYFYDAAFSPLVISDELREEVRALKRIATHMDLSFGDEFWNCSILDGMGCPQPRADFRAVRKLPVEVVMKIKDVHKMLQSQQPLGYTNGDALENNTSITWIDQSHFDQLDLTDQAIALVHERMWAKFGLTLSYTHLTWYTQTLRMLRDVDAGRKKYDQSAHDFLMKYSYYTFGIITGHQVNKNKFKNFKIINNGKGVFFTTFEGDLSQIRFLTADDQEVSGFLVQEDEGSLTLDADPNNQIIFKMEPEATRIHFSGALTVKGHNNFVSIQFIDKFKHLGITHENGSSWDRWENVIEIIGNNNHIESSNSKSSVDGNYNTVLQSANFNIKGSNNSLNRTHAISILGDENTFESTLFCFITGSENSVTSGERATILGNQNSVNIFDRINIEGNSNTFVEQGSSPFGGHDSSKIIGDNNQINYSKALRIHGSSNQLTNCSDLSLTGSGNNFKNAYYREFSANNKTKIYRIKK